jgi:hypothetical protein
MSPAVLAQTLAGQLQPALLVRIAFLTETVYLWSGLGSITAPGPPYDPASTFPYGSAFTGIGWLGTIRTIPEVTDVVASNITLEMSGIPVDLVTDAINAVRQTAIATVWLGFLSMAPGNPQIIGDPVQVFQGALDVPTITEGAATCAIAITCENPLIDLNRAPERRFTDVDQQVDYPGDTGFFQVQLLQDYLVLWPSPYQSNPNQTQRQPNFLTIQPGQSGPIAIAVGETVQLVATVTYSDGTTQIVMGPGGPSGWGCQVYSSDQSIAQLANGGTGSGGGIVTGLKQGMCVVTARFVYGAFFGSGVTKPTTPVTASVTIIVTEAA